MLKAQLKMSENDFLPQERGGGEGGGGRGGRKEKNKEEKNQKQQL